MIHFQQLDKPQGPAFERAMDIYTASFPPEERHPVETVRKRVQSGAYRFFTGSEGSEVVFTAWLFAVPGSDYLLFDYMAVRPDCRSRGYGSAFLTFLKNEVLKNSPARFVLFEVEDPQKGQNQAERQRRYRFYRKNGLLTLQGVRYVLPPLDGSGQATEMVLMLLSPNGERLEREGLITAVTAIYRELYSRGLDDSCLREFLNSVPDTIQLN